MVKSLETVVREEREKERFILGIIFSVMIEKERRSAGKRVRGCSC